MSQTLERAFKDNVLSEDKGFTLATAVEINNIIKHLNAKKATGPDKVPVRIIKLAVNIIDSHITKIIN